MCGFTGFSTGRQAVDRQQVIQDMTDLIRHRGPDAEGFYLDERIALGFRRLSVIDLSERANQPFAADDGQLRMVFNGEIYNFQAIRDELMAKGHRFVSETDSEVVIHGYKEWGADIVTRLRGMFAFAIVDLRRGSLFMARDLFGIKPLFYTQNTTDGSFIFGSEIKSFLAHPAFVKELNKNALKPYLTFQYSALPETFFAGVYKLPPGSTLMMPDITQPEQFTITPYASIRFAAEDRPLEAICDEIDRVMSESAQAHQISDVQVGAFLSGGIDSSYIVALTKPDNTFSVGFAGYDGQFNETELALKLSAHLGIEHHRRLITAEDCFGQLPTIQYHMDEPQANLSSVPLWFLAELAAQRVKVVLSGEGADELFGGYETYRDSRAMTAYKKLPFGLRRAIGRRMPEKGRGRVADFLFRGGQTVEETTVGEAFIYSPEEADALLQEPYRQGPSAFDVSTDVLKKYSDLDEMSKKQLIDILLWMPGDILVKADRMSAAHSLELRVPFLDRQVLDVAQRVPVRYRANRKNTKYALRQTALRHLPQEWAERIKVGFMVPFRDWLRDPVYYNQIKDVFQSDYAAEFFDVAQLMRLLDAHHTGQALHQRQIYTAYVFLIWYREYFIRR